MAERGALRERLRGAFARADYLRPRPELSEELRQRLRPQPRQVSRRSVLQSWWAIAAGLVLAAGGGLFVRGAGSRSRLAVLARAAAGDHQNCAIRFNLAEQPIALEEAGRRYGAPYTALATFQPPAVAGPLEPIGRHSCVYDGRRFGHVIFSSRGTVVSLLVTTGTPPDAPALEPAEPGPAVVAMPAGPFVAFVVADLDGRELLQLAQTLANPLSRLLA
jgi:hypothetical protein